MSTSKSYSLVIVVLAVFVLLSGVLTLIGWQWDVVALKSLAVRFTPMNPLTATTFILCGLWLIKSRFREYMFLRITGTFLACMVTYIGLAHFITYLVPYPSIRFDNIFFGEKIINSGIQNMVAPNTAFVFSLSGISMLLSHSRNRNLHLVRQGLIFIGFSIVYLSLVGYLFEINHAYRFAYYTPMALTTAIVLAMLNIGIFLCNTDYGMARNFTTALRGGVLLRRITPFLLVGPMAIGYLRLLGERKGLYSTEFGVGLYTFTFALAVFAFIYVFAVLESRQQLSRTKAQLQLANSELRFRTLYNTLTEGVLTIDGTGKVLFCNPAFSQITGFTETELRNKSAVTVFFVEAEQHILYSMLDNPSLMESGRFRPRIFTKSGDMIWVNLKITPLQLGKDEATNFLITIVDVTKERMNHEDLKAFTASAAHDLNAPLSRIIMAFEIFERDNLNDEQKMLIEAVTSTTHNMRQLLIDLLAYSKLGAGKLEKTELNMNTIVADICKQETSNEFKGTLHLNPLPAQVANEPAVRQLLTNLVSNAVKYSSETDKPEVAIGALQQDKDTVFYVKDNGVGMSVENLKDLFKPFKRFHTSFEGNGMGLAIVKRIVEKHGGKIWVESTPNVGTAFYFTLHG